jgi:hypothetical protein
MSTESKRRPRSAPETLIERRSLKAKFEAVGRELKSHQPVAQGQFELFRLSKSKEVVDVCPNTIRSYFKQGLPCYKRGKAVFVSRSELAQFIMG